jgi:hypothetical protein
MFDPDNALDTEVATTPAITHEQSTAANLFNFLAGENLLYTLQSL